MHEQFKFVKFAHETKKKMLFVKTKSYFDKIWFTSVSFVLFTNDDRKYQNDRKK